MIGLLEGSGKPFVLISGTALLPPAVPAPNRSRPPPAARPLHASEETAPAAANRRMRTKYRAAGGLRPRPDQPRLSSTARVCRFALEKARTAGWRSTDSTPERVYRLALRKSSAWNAPAYPTPLQKCTEIGSQHMHEMRYTLTDSPRTEIIKMICQQQLSSAASMGRREKEKSSRS